MNSSPALAFADRSVSVAITKERWTSIFIKIDNYIRFTHSFLIPFVEELKEQNIISSFYYRLAYDFWPGATLDSTIQLSCYVSQFNFEKHLKPKLFKELNEYFDQDFLNSLNVQQFDESLLERKQGLSGLDIKNIEFIGIEEFLIEEITLFVGKFGTQNLYELYKKSTSLFLENILPEEQKWTEEFKVEKSILLNYPVLHGFLKDREEMYHFLAWTVFKMTMQIHKIQGVEDLYDWKFELMKETNRYFEEQKDSFIGYSKFLLDSLDNNDEFEDNWLNEWVDATKRCKNRMNNVITQKSMPTLPFPHSHDMSVFHEINESTYRNWMTIYDIMKNNNSMLGITFHLEFRLFCAMKNSLKVLKSE